MKLSKKLIEILQRMNNGWELGINNGYQGYNWSIQQGGLGRGGNCIYPHGRTKISLLIKEGFITNDGKHHFPTTPYFLTDKGKEFLKGIK